jgi:hypothetical protein
MKFAKQIASRQVVRHPFNRMRHDNTYTIQPLANYLPRNNGLGGFSLKKITNVVKSAVKTVASVVTKPAELVANVIAPHGAMAKGGSLSNKLVASREDVLKTGRAALKVGAVVGAGTLAYGAYGILASAPGVASAGGLTTGAGISAAASSLTGGAVSAVAADTLYTAAVEKGQEALTDRAYNTVQEALSPPAPSVPVPSATPGAPAPDYFKIAALAIPVIAILTAKN